MAWTDLPPKPNLLLIITDQQRQVSSDWPSDWVQNNLPSLQRLMNHGVTFTQAYCAACECSPSRSAIVTSTYPEQNGITTTQPPISLPRPPELPNLGSILSAAGYQVVWKGKWHLTNPVVSQPGGSLVPWDFQGWDSPDAGTTLDRTLLGGGTDGYDEGYTNDAISFLKSYDSSKGPFCLILSLVNPHDIHIWALPPFSQSGYPSDLGSLVGTMGISLPTNGDDSFNGVSLLSKPRVQRLFLSDWNSVHPLNLPKYPCVTPLGYVNCYAYLQTLADQQIGRVLSTLDDLQLTDSTLIVRFGDHGEMGLSHGLREKMYNAYEEIINVPLVFSNPLAFPTGQQTDAFASLLDLLPTLASVAGVTPPMGLRGVNLSPVLNDPSSSVQSSILYTYDDGFASVSAGLNDTLIATHIRAIRQDGWMYAVYFSQTPPQPGQQPDPCPVPMEFELYNLVYDPGELANLLFYEYPDSPPAQDVIDQWQALHTALTNLMTRKGAMPKIPSGCVPWPDTIGVDLLNGLPLPLPSSDPAEFAAAVAAKAG